MASPDCPEPAGKCGGVGKAWQGRPRGDEGLLNHVLGLLKVAGNGQCRAERSVLEPSREFDEGLNFATARATY
jgi:hypothetical protein